MPGATFCFSACPQRGGRCGYNAAVTSIPAPVLPDVAHQTAALARPLDWVGMDNIALPIRITDGQGGFLQVPASIDLAVDLARADARGIHMSRLYLQLQDGLARDAITPAGLRHLLQDGIAAQGAWFRAVDPATPAGEREALRAQLLRYCGYDTLAMVRVVEFIERKGKSAAI